MTIEQTIRELAHKHHITAQRTPIDDFADDINRLSDAEVKLDEVEQLIVNLRRSGMITSKQLTEFQTQYIIESN